MRPTVPCTGRSFDNAEVYADGKAEEVRNFVFVSVHLVDIFACTRFDVACGACRSWGRPSRCASCSRSWLRLLARACRAGLSPCARRSWTSRAAALS